MDELRIVSGKYKGRSLKSPEGKGTRPLLTRLRKSLADILRPRLPGCRVLDVFGGTGAISFELLSNGAEEAVIVELDPAAASIIKENARKLGAPVNVMTGDALAAVDLLWASKRLFDIVVVAPPYGLGLQKKTMDALSAKPLLRQGGTAIVQREAAEPFWEAVQPLEHERTRKYGRTVFDFYTIGSGGNND